MGAQHLAEQEVRRRLTLYENDEITEELYGFGTMLISNAMQRISRMHTTAGLVTAYCAGLITVLTSTAAIWGNRLGPWERCLPIMGAGLAILGAALALSSTSLQTVDWFSQDDWLKEDCLQDHKRLRKYHVLSMWGVVTSFDIAHRRKTRRIKAAQWLTGIAVVLLFATLLKVTWQLGFI
jgi:hypothetical protein